MAASRTSSTRAALLFDYDEGALAKARANMVLGPDVARALFVAERSRVDFVYHTAALEGNPFTYPEVKTLLEGITVGGHKITDADQVSRLNQALSHVIARVREKRFEFSAAAAKEIQGIVAKNEALTSGVFRDGMVFIGGTDYTVPRAEDLEELFARGKAHLDAVVDPVQKAFLVFLWGSLIQFFYDGNKRTSRLLCNGILLSAGFPPMMITKQEQLAYNQVMTAFYNSQEATDAMLWFYDRYRERVAHFGFARP